jgi:nucleoside-diphosphate-sugar epimerase
MMSDELLYIHWLSKLTWSMKILITGATGFLGSHLAAALLAQGHQLTLLGRDFSTVQAQLAAGATPLAIDLRDRAAVIAACAGMELVYHVGALSTAWGQWADFYGINVEGTRAAVDGCMHHAVRRLIYVSSPSVVFDGQDQININETQPYPKRFTSPYAATKKIGEDLVNAAHAQGLPTVIMRPKAIFGPGDRALLPRLIDRARQMRLPQIGNGDNLVDLTYVDNVVHALLLAADAPHAVGQTYFITNNEHIPLWLTIRYVLYQRHLSTNLRTIPVPVALTIAWLLELNARRTGREPLLTRYTVGILARTQTYDIRAAQHDLGYQPQLSVADGLARTLHAAATHEKTAV